MIRLLRNIPCSLSLPTLSGVPTASLTIFLGSGNLRAQAVWINTADAQARGIKDGDKVRVFNDRGEMIIPARVTERIMPGVVDIPQGCLV